MAKNLILIVCFIFAGSSLVAGIPIPVNNPDFENHDPGCSDPVGTINGSIGICDWDAGADPGLAWRLFAMNGTWATNNGTPDTTLCDIDGGWVEQSLGVPIAAGITYTLSFDWIIEWATGAQEGIIAEFVDMDTDQVVATETFESFAGGKRPNTLWETRASTNYVAGAAEAGAILGIRLTGIGDAWVAVDNVAVDFEGITVGTITETDGFTEVSESTASSDTYVITLTSEPPPSGVKITVVSTDPDCLDANPARQLDITPAGWCGVAGSSAVTFTQANWQTPQTITVQARNDGVVEGDHSVTMTHSVELVVPGEDPNNINYPDYAAPTLSGALVTVDIRDAHDVTIVGHEALEVAEAGATSDEFTVVLTIAPTADVTVGLDLSGGSLSSQVTTNAVTFTPGDWSTPKTITLTAIDDLLIEPDVLAMTAPLVITTADVNYQAITLPGIDFTVLDDDVRVCSIGDEFDLTNLLLSNPGFESPVVADGAWFTDPNNPVDFAVSLGNPAGRPESEARIRNYTASQFSDRYPAATVLPGGEQVLSLFGDVELVRNVPTADYLVEGGTISYKMSAKIGRPRIFDTIGGGYIDNPTITPVRIVLLASGGNFQHPQTYEWLAADIPNGDFKVIEFCWDVPADRAGEPMVIRVDGVDVDVDDLQISVACAHCDGYCYPAIGLAGGDLDDNCIVDLVDFAMMGGNWLRCDLWPQSECLGGP